MKRFGLIILIVLTLVSCSNKNKSCKCEDLPEVMPDYLISPYLGKIYDWETKEYSKERVKFINKIGDTMSLRVSYLDEQYMSEAIVGSYPCYAYTCCKFDSIAINGVTINNIDEIEFKIGVYQNRYKVNDQDGKYDIYDVSLSVDDHIDVNLTREFQNKANWSEIIEVTAIEGTCKWYNRFIIEREKGVVELEDMVNKCTWKLVE